VSGLSRLARGFSSCLLAIFPRSSFLLARWRIKKALIRWKNNPNSLLLFGYSRTNFVDFAFCVRV
jgi:hypothetical protein